MSAMDQLCEKMSDEYDRFIEGLKNKPPGEIIDASYSKVFKEEILSIVENDDIFDDDEARALLALEEPLQEMYEGWLHADSSYLDIVRDSMTERVKRIIEHPEWYAPEKADTGMRKAAAVNGDIQRGDWVISAGNNDYKYLIGQVIEIVKLGTPEHADETDNDTDNVHVNFYAFDYPPERIAEIEAHFSELYGEPKDIDELPLDDTIMAPDMLIRITELGRDEIDHMGNLLHNCEAFCACFPGGGEPLSPKHAVLVERLNKNLSEYNDALMGFGKQELIDMAGKIIATSDTHTYMAMYQRYTDDELDFFLKFNNPLEIVADVWHERRSDLEDMSFTMDDISSRREDFLAAYPLKCNKDSPIQGIAALPIEAEPVSVKPKQTLSEKLQAAGEKAKAQDIRSNNTITSPKRGERE